MKVAFASVFLIAIPAILFAMLLVAIIPLLVQRFFTPTSSENTEVYPYLTSWEEPAQQAA